MKRITKKLRNLVFAISFLEVGIVAGFAVCYFNDFFSFQSIIKPTYIILGFSGLFVFEILFLWSFVGKVAKIRQKNDLDAAEIIGSDIQEAYNFAMVGLVITNNENIIVWTNTLFKDRQIDIIDNNIFEWQPGLIPLQDPQNKDKDQVANLTINARKYQVKFVREAGLWIFKDNTDFEAVISYSKDQSPVLGIIEIDNYEDVAHNEERNIEVINNIKNIIFNYGKENSALIKRLKENSFLMLTNYDSFRKMKDTKFSFIDKVRECSVDQEVPLTISAGIAYDFPDFNKLNELAAAALEIAMSRGGDQVVVSPYGNEMEFYGGKSEAVEKHNRVKSRVLADSLISFIKNSSNVLIMGHAKMDMDALGACLGIKAICNRLNVRSNIVVDLKNTEIKTRAAIASSFNKDEVDDIFVTSKQSENLVEDRTLLCVLDCHIGSMTMNPELVESVQKVLVIDHHRRSEEYIEAPVFNHIDPSASSSCEIITEFIRFATLNPKVIIPANYATIMLSGIFLDSCNFKSKSTGIRTFEASTILKEYGADNSLADDFLKDDYEEFKSINDIVSTLDYPHTGIAVAVANPDETYDLATIAKAANTCLAFKGVKAAFVIGKIDKTTVKLSARGDGSINIQFLVEKLGGGGHYSMAACTFEKTTLETVKNQIYEVLDKYLLEASKDGKNGENY